MNKTVLNKLWSVTYTTHQIIPGVTLLSLPPTGSVGVELRALASVGVTLRCLDVTRLPLMLSEGNPESVETMLTLMKPWSARMSRLAALVESESERCMEEPLGELAIIWTWIDIFQYEIFQIISVTFMDLCVKETIHPKGYKINMHDDIMNKNIFCL